MDISWIRGRACEMRHVNQKRKELHAYNIKTSTCNTSKIITNNYIARLGSDYERLDMRRDYV